MHQRAQLIVTATVLVGGLLASGCAATSDADTSNLPATEASFLKTVSTGQEAADETENELKLVGLQKTRNDALCKLLNKRKMVRDWEGTVASVDTTLGGDSGVLDVEVADDVNVATWNNAFSDIGSRSLIKKDSPLYATLANLEEDDKVRFSGTFVLDRESCIKEASMGDQGSMMTPMFIFRFSAVSTA